MEILIDAEAKKIRKQYICEFIDTKSQYYIERILKEKLCVDGFCYTGYLWDCFKMSNVIDEESGINYLSKKKKLMIFWDIHSKEMIQIPNYWKFPKDAVVKTTYNEFLENMHLFPEDIYFFDDSFKWTIALTHETNLQNNRWCLLIDKQKESF